ncbi:MAG: hypothetical protein KAU28_06075, partial [Phycisphaerae bacterium]|nr:hypothetical protein [Phycisphaerae bacterium]
MHELLVSLLVFFAVVAFGGAIISARSARRKRLQKRLGQWKWQRDAAEDAQGGSWLSRLLNGVGSTVSSSRASVSLKENLTRAGYYDTNAASIYLGAKVFLLLIGFVGVFVFLLPLSLSLPLKVLLVLMGAALMFFAPNFIVDQRRRRRATDIR